MGLNERSDRNQFTGGARNCLDMMRQPVGHGGCFHGFAISADRRLRRATPTAMRLSTRRPSMVCRSQVMLAGPACGPEQFGVAIDTRQISASRSERPIATMEPEEEYLAAPAAVAEEAIPFDQESLTEHGCSNRERRLQGAGGNPAATASSVPEG